MTTEQANILAQIIEQRSKNTWLLAELSNEIEDTGEASQLLKITEKDLEITTSLLNLAK